MNKRLSMLGAIAALFFWAGQALAISYSGTVQFTCTDFTAAGTGSSTLNRDNTGAGMEQFQILVLDGAGHTLYNQTFSNTLGTYAGGVINTTAYTTAPSFNPLTFELISLAGNGLPQQLGYQAQGACGGLPSFAPVAVPTTSPASLAVIALFVLGASFLVIRRRSRKR